MSSNQTVNGVISSYVVDDQIEVTLEDICSACHAERTEIVALVDEGIVEPSNRGNQPWRFSGEILPRVARAMRLQRDLGLNVAGVAFALDLLGEIEDLRKRLKRMGPEEVIYDD